MPDANYVNYSNAAFTKTNQFKAQILQAAQASGLRPETIYGSLVEESHDYFNERLKNAVGDDYVIGRLLIGLDHQTLLNKYNQAHAQAR